MANIDDILAADLAATAFDPDATESPVESVTYTPAGGEPVVRNVIMTPAEEVRDEDEDGMRKVKRRSATIRTDAETGIVAPAIDDSINFDSLDWKVAAIEQAGSGIATLTIVTYDAVSKHHETHKRRLPI